jgi:membrane-associated protease RseP (regulator of RpoE activity)
VKLDDLNAPLYLGAGGIYGWTVCDVDDSNQTEGHVARSSSAVFLTKGGGALAEKRHLTDYMRDERIEARIGISIQQPYQPSDGSPVSLQIIGIGRNSAALKAGLEPGDEIRLANGKGVATLNELHSIIAMLPRGAPLRLGIETYDVATKKRLSKDVTLTGV